MDEKLEDLKYSLNLRTESSILIELVLVYLRTHEDYYLELAILEKITKDQSLM